MHYEILDTDVGQGAVAVAVPVTYGKPVERTDICQPYSVAEVLQNVFHADFQAVLENYVRTETEQIQASGVLPGAENEGSAVFVLKNSVKATAINRQDCGRCDIAE